MAALHTFLATWFVLSGSWEFVLLFTLAPFWFGWLELLVNYPQHAGMKIDSPHLHETTRSLKLPGWLSFLHWHMEFHVEHHQWPSVPCYRLRAFSAVAGTPTPQSLWRAWRDILRPRKPDECGHGSNPVERLLQSTLSAGDSR